MSLSPHCWDYCLDYAAHPWMYCYSARCSSHRSYPASREHADVEAWVHGTDATARDTLEMVQERLSAFVYLCLDHRSLGSKTPQRSDDRESRSRGYRERTLNHLFFHFAATRRARTKLGARSTHAVNSPFGTVASSWPALEPASSPYDQTPPCASDHIMLKQQTQEPST